MNEWEGENYIRLGINAAGITIPQWQACLFITYLFIYVADMLSGMKIAGQIGKNSSGHATLF